MFYEDFHGRATCRQCGRVGSYVPYTKRTRSGMYRCVHYLHSLLKMYNIGERRVEQRHLRRVRALWLRAAQPAPTKKRLQAVLRTKRAAELRPYLRNWRQISFALTGERPPRMSKRVLHAVHVDFVLLHTVYTKLGYYRTRRSFLNFPFLIRRILERRGLDHMVQHWPGLSGDDKYLVHYTIYAALCRDLGWPLVVSDF